MEPTEEQKLEASNRLAAALEAHTKAINDALQQLTDPYGLGGKLDALAQGLNRR